MPRNVGVSLMTRPALLNFACHEKWCACLAVTPKHLRQALPGYSKITMAQLKLADEELCPALGAHQWFHCSSSRSNAYTSREGF
eukprot:5370088-Amphidinium_carterae.1